LADDAVIHRAARADQLNKWAEEMIMPGVVARRGAASRGSRAQAGTLLPERRVFGPQNQEVHLVRSVRCPSASFATFDFAGRQVEPLPISAPPTAAGRRNEHTNRVLGVRV